MGIIPVILKCNFILYIFFPYIEPDGGGEISGNSILIFPKERRDREEDFSVFMGVDCFLSGLHNIYLKGSHLFRMGLVCYGKIKS